ncbi:hypothetical protein ACFX2B_030289 [Malus domestica]
MASNLLKIHTKTIKTPNPPPTPHSHFSNTTKTLTSPSLQPSSKTQNYHFICTLLLLILLPHSSNLQRIRHQTSQNLPPHHPLLAPQQPPPHHEAQEAQTTPIPT